MNQLQERLQTIEQKRKLFKQQQFTFISALERSREHARDRTEPVSTVAQVQRYMTHHCNNATERRILSLFLNIMSDLEAAFKLVESTASTHHPSSEALETWRTRFSPNCNISQLQAHYPHDEINRLSCNEARNYGGVVSVIPLALDLLNTAFTELSRSAFHKSCPTPTTSNRPVMQTADNSERSPFAGQSRKTTYTSTQSAKGMSTGVGGWHAAKPAWRPSGCRRF